MDSLHNGRVDEVIFPRRIPAKLPILSAEEPDRVSWPQASVSQRMAIEQRSRWRGCVIEISPTLDDICWHKLVAGKRFCRPLLSACNDPQLVCNHLGTIQSGKTTIATCKKLLVVSLAAELAQSNKWATTWGGCRTSQKHFLPLMLLIVAFTTRGK